MSRYFCPTCGRYRNLSLTYKPTLFTVRDTTYSYSEVIAQCPKCKESVYIPKVNDINADLRELVVYLNN